MTDPYSPQTGNSIPEPVAQIAELMFAFGAPWAICGGWAIDAWVGRPTREHGDVDIAAFIQHQQALFHHLSGWELVAHVSGDTHEPWDGRPLALPNHIEARLDTGEALPGPADAGTQRYLHLDIQLNELSGDDWILWERPRISVPLGTGFRESLWGLPTVVPEVLLFFKAWELRRRDKLDFAAVLPHLAGEQRKWLRSAISLAEHPWLPELSR